jgi:hypothetical protein
MVQCPRTVKAMGSSEDALAATEKSRAPYVFLVRGPNAIV